MALNYITGIQQIGIGVHDATQAALHYKNLFNMGVLVFDYTSDAALMTQYTGGTVYKRRALLTLNMQGGGGFEIWQFLNRPPQGCKTIPKFGDLGIFAAILKCADAGYAHHLLSKNDAILLSKIHLCDATASRYFWLQDGFWNTFQVKEYSEQFNGISYATGGVLGAVIGVSDMDKCTGPL